MPSNFTMYGRSQMLRAMFTPDVFVAPTGIEITLTRTVPPANASVDQLVEPTAAEYVRQAYGATGALWAPSGFGELYNTEKITFPQVATSWGWLSGWAIIDPGSGQVINSGSLMEPYVAIVGMIPYLDPGTIMLGLYD